MELSSHRPLPPPYRADIDGLRAIAILAVVAFHAFPGRLPGGFVGVDVFFVISGYLITSIILSDLGLGRFTLGNFYRRRMRRIFPALLVVMAASLVLGWPLLLSAEYGELGKHVAGGAAFVSNFVLYGESNYFDKAAQTKPLLHLWSLAIEEQFYIFWPLLLVAIWRWRWVAITSAFAMVSFAINLYLSANAPAAAFYWPIGRFWELAVGAILAGLAAQGFIGPSRWANLLSCAGMLLLVTGFALIDREKHFPGAWVLLPVVGCMLLVHAGPGAWINRHILSNRAMVAVGLISYPLYLWHWSLLSFAFLYSNYYLPSWQKAALVALSFVLAALTYRFIETPIRFQRARPAKTRLLAGSMLAMFTLALAVHSGLVKNRSIYYEIEMTESAIQKAKNDFWVGADHRFEQGHPRVIVFGDSQARDIFNALRNDPAMGLRYFNSPAKCNGFDQAQDGKPADTRECDALFKAMQESPEIAKADVLIYTRLWSDQALRLSDFERNIKKLLNVNPHLRIQLWGAKPHLGSRDISIRRIMRDYGKSTGINTYLTQLALLDDTSAQPKLAASRLGAEWVDVSAIYCSGGCMFHGSEQFAYFDSDHWTSFGAATFYKAFRQSTAYTALVGVAEH
jgi:peptidoglycan/LPS O-acetylase OafA/YrhL